MPAGNGLARPLWRRRAGAPIPGAAAITASVAPGEPGSPDKTAAAADEIAAFVGTAAPDDFDVERRRGDLFRAGRVVAPPARPALRHSSARRRAASMPSCIGSELRGLTTLRSSASAYPFVAALVDLADDVRAVLGAGDEDLLRRRLERVFRPPAGRRLGRRLLPSRSALGERRRSTSSASTTTCRSPTGATAATISTRRLGTPGATRPISAPTSPAARASTGTTPSDADRDGADAHADHRRRLRQAVGVPRQGPRRLVGQPALRPAGRRRGGERRPPGCRKAKPIWFTELGCPAVDKGPNQPNVFPDPKSSASGAALFLDRRARRPRPAPVHRGDARLLGPGRRRTSTTAPTRSRRSMAGGWSTTRAIHLWTWDARPFPAFPLPRSTSGRTAPTGRPATG